MLRWSIGFLVLALIAGVFGFGGVAGAAVDIGKLLFFGFIVLAVGGFIVNALGSGKA